MIDPFEKMPQISNRHTIRVHVHEDNTFTYNVGKRKEFHMNEKGYLEAIDYIERLDN